MSWLTELGELAERGFSAAVEYERAKSGVNGDVTRDRPERAQEPVDDGRSVSDDIMSSRNLVFLGIAGLLLILLIVLLRK